MFGYVTIDKDELKVKDYNLFKAFYCGLCKSLGKCTNQFTRFGLNYDFTFLALLLTSLDEKCPVIKQEKCIANPFRKKPIIQMNKHLEHVAYLNTIFVYYKLLDNWKDEHSYKSLAAMAFYYFPIKKAKKQCKCNCEYFKNFLQELEDLELNGNKIIDKSADAFARIMGKIFTPNYIVDEKKKRILNWLGYNLGRWIYVMDAFNDIEEDIKNKNYNPILLQYNYSNEEELQDFLSRVKKPIEFSLTLTLDGIAKSYELLEVNRFNEILDNIIYLGMRKNMEQVLKIGGKDNEKSLRSIGNKRRSQ